MSTGCDRLLSVDAPCSALLVGCYLSLVVVVNRLVPARWLGDADLHFALSALLSLASSDHLVSVTRLDGRKCGLGLAVGTVFA